MPTHPEGCNGSVDDGVAVAINVEAPDAGLLSAFAYRSPHSADRFLLCAAIGACDTRYRYGIVAPSHSQDSLDHLCDDLAADCSMRCQGFGLDS